MKWKLKSLKRLLTPYMAKTVTVIVILVLSLHPFRFSETSLSLNLLKESEVMAALQKNALKPSDPFLEPCELEMSRLTDWPKNTSDRHLYVTKDGNWRPKACQPRYETTIVIPYRNRPDQLETFMTYMHPFLQAQNLSYNIYVIEQLDGKPFNRGKLFNVGFLEASKSSKNPKQCFVFHDVDLLPLNAQNLYACSRRLPIHLSAFVDTFRFNLPYDTLFGGALAISHDTFKAVNGFSNLFFGWGGEDDDLWLNRMSRYTDRVMLRYDSAISKYQMLHHERETPSEDRFVMLEKGRLNSDEDGLENIDYNVISNVQRDLYTHLLVAV